jgi:hypothetical protein
MKTLLLILAVSVVVQAQSIKCEASKNKATVYFYRVKEANAVRKGETEITIDRVRLLEMPKGTYVGFQFLPSKYRLTMGHHEPDFLLNAEAGKRYFFRVSNTAKGFRPLQILSEVPEEQALRQMGGLKPLAKSDLKSRVGERCDFPK